MRCRRGLGRRWACSVFHPGIVMEGGAVDFNGAGTVLTTTSCLLNKNRNPHLSRAQVERYLRDYYGQRHVVWLGDGIEGDDTDGHVDDLARFIDARTIAMGIERNRRDPNFAVLQRARRALDRALDQDGRPFDVVELPMPRPVVIEGQRAARHLHELLFRERGPAGTHIRPARPGQPGPGRAPSPPTPPPGGGSGLPGA